MEAYGVVRLLASKAIAPAEFKRRGNPGYGRVKTLRILLYARLKKLDNNTKTNKHINKYP